MRSKWRLPASSRSSRFGRGRRKPDWGSMSEGMSPSIVGDAPAGVKAVRERANRNDADAADQGSGGSRAHPWRDANTRSCRLSEGDTPSVLEGGPGLERVPPIDSVVQQKAFQE